jgi:hypothetical protein
MCRSFGKLVTLSVLGPLIAMIPFVLNITDECVNSLIGHSIWYGGKKRYFSLYLFSLSPWPSLSF